MAAFPRWARLLLAAKWLRVAPWDLMQTDDPDFWIEAVNVISSAQNEASEQRAAAAKASAKAT